MNRTGIFLSGILALFCAPAGAFEPIYERAPIHYHETEPDTEVTRFFASAKPGGIFAADDDSEILASLLEQFGVPVESQVLVFSKTSAQNSRISPRTPRAIYFSDNLYMGWVQGGEIEVASLDEKLGMVFHLIKLTTREPNQPPQLTRERSCLNCHAGSSNQNMPGLMVRSVFAQNSGLPLFQAGTFHTRQDSPIEERWGGWYVTGSVEDSPHMGNCLASADRRDTEVTLHPLAEGAVSALGEMFDDEPYLAKGTSDVVALMTLEHQVGMHNVMVEANLTTRSTLHRHREMQKAFGESPNAPLSDTNQRILNNVAERVLEQMLYADELAVPGGIEGGPAFQSAFSENRVKSEDGRSLKDFRLYERLMKYRCSHLIYSEAFAHLPDEIRTIILDTLRGILTEPDSWPDFAHLGDSEREHILEILTETLPDLPPSWKKG
jgi:hypothetical protein